MNKLPDWFDWDHYRSFIGNEDYAFWAYQFYVRDPNYEMERDRGVATRGYYPAGYDPSAQLQQKTAWENGVLSVSWHGHGTLYYLEETVKHDARHARFITNEEYERLRSNNKLTDGYVYTQPGSKLVGGERGYLEFKSQEEFEEYEKRFNATFKDTVSMALNIHMPKKALMDQVEKLIDDYQRRYRQEIKRPKITGKISDRWARGLACWDLLSMDCSKYLIAKELVPLWSKDARGRKKGDDYSSNAQKANERLVKKGIEDVKVYIEGGWKVLAGDPRSTSDLVSDIRQAKKNK